MSSSSSNNVVAFGAEKMIYDSVQRFSVINLNDLIRVLMENIDDSLFELSDKAKNDRDRNMYFEAMREIRLKRESIKETFNSELEKQFSNLFQNKKASVKLEQFGELSLVDQDELEDSLAIDNMISKARPHFEDELMAISARLKAILKRKSLADDENPLDPKSICDSFHNASETLDLDIQIKLIFYKLFDKYVITNLGHFYSELNDFFIKKGVLANYTAAEDRANQTTQFMANRIRSNPNADSEKQEFSGSLAQQSSQSETTNAPAVEGSLLALLQQMMTPNAVQTPTNQTNDIPMVDLATGESTNSNTSSTHPMMITQGAQKTAYISALTNLQSSNLPSVNIQENDNPETVKAQLQQQIVAFKNDHKDQTSAVDNQLIDIVSMIFDFFFEDDDLPNPIKVLIGRLQIPILKVAMIDSSFFHSKKHPARALLDHISKASLGLDKNQEDVLVDKVEEIVESLLVDFDEDISVFEAALDSFNEFVDELEASTKKHIETIIDDEQANDEKITEAHNQSDAFIKKIIDKYDLSFDIVDFLDGQWKSVLYMTFLTQGYDSNHGKKIKHITNTLIWTLIAKHTDEDKKKLFKTLPALLRAMSKGMELVKIDEEAKNAVFKMLVIEHAKVVKLSNQNIVTRVDDKTIWPQNNTEDAFANFNKALKEKGTVDISLNDIGATDIEEDTIYDIIESETKDVISNLDEFTKSIAKGDIQIDDEIIMDSSPHLQTHIETNAENDDFLETAQALEIGTWVEFNEIGSTPIQGKLSWKSNVTGKYVFTDRHGTKIKNITSFGLAVEIRSGNAKLMQSSSVFDRAISSLMNTMGR